ncbi:hypothetical protein ACVWZD_003019 [Streptomyces sp. TE3672]
MPEPLTEPYGLQSLGGPLPALGRPAAERYESGLDVLLGGERRDEVEALEDEPDVLGAQPYSDSRTLSWARLMPVETELTTMTSAMPSASPEATTSAAFLRRRSSRRR